MTGGAADQASPLTSYQQGAADERERIVWWLRAAAEGPASVNVSKDYVAAIHDMATAIAEHPDRFAEAPPHRASTTSSPDCTGSR